jgi:perosamine synthetase
MPDDHERWADSFLYFRGRVGLFAVLSALGVGEGDEVVLQAFTCVALPEAIMAAGAVPVYADIEPGGVNMDPSSLSTVVTTRTRAIIVQHTFGIPAALKEIMAVANAAGLPVVEDCCHAHYSTLDGCRVGHFGVAAFYSFEWGKPVVAGVGGAVVANMPLLRAELDRSFALFSEPPGRVEAKLRLQYAMHRRLYRPSLYWTLRALYHLGSRAHLVTPSFNALPRHGSRSPEFSWRMASSTVKHLRQQSEKPASEPTIRERTRRYDEMLPAGYRGRPSGPPLASTVFSRYPLLVDDKAGLIAAAQREGVELAGWYATPVHPLPLHASFAANYRRGSCPHAEEASARIVSLSLSDALTESDMEKTARLMERLA